MQALPVVLDLPALQDEVRLRSPGGSRLVPRAHQWEVQVIPRFCSYSQIKTWLDCRRQWSYKFRDGFRPKQPNLDFMRGSLLHLGMEHAIPGVEPDWWVYALKEWAEEWSFPGDELVVAPDFYEGCKKIVEGAVEVFHQDWELLSDSKGPLLERRFYVDLPGWRGLIFIPDAVCRKKTEPYAGGIFGVDFKSFGKPKEELAGELDLQGAIYQRGLREKGLGAIGTCLFEIAAQPPKTARVNKDGTLNATDERMILSWKAVPGQILTYRSEEFLDGVWNQLVLPTAAEIADQEGARRDFELIPHLTYYGCKYCDFRTPCLARLKGLDEDAILQDTYNRRERRQKGA